MSGAFEDPIEQKRLELLRKKAGIENKYETNKDYQRKKYKSLKKAGKDDDRRNYLENLDKLKEYYEKDIVLINKEIEKIESCKDQYKLSITDLLKLKVQEPNYLIFSSIIAAVCATNAYYHLPKRILFS